MKFVDAASGGGGRTSWERGVEAKTVIAKVRYTCGMTQVEFAKAAGIRNPAQISHYESGRMKPRVDTAKKVIAFAKSQGIEVKLDDFYEGEA